MARAYHVAPSELLGLRTANGNDSYLAFAIDRAVWTFGSCVEHDMSEAENDPRLKDAKRDDLIRARQRVFDMYMNVDEEQSVKAPPPKGRFADPMAAIQAGRTGR